MASSRPSSPSGRASRRKTSCSCGTRSTTCSSTTARPRAARWRRAELIAFKHASALGNAPAHASVRPGHGRQATVGDDDPAAGDPAAWTICRPPAFFRLSSRRSTAMACPKASKSSSLSDAIRESGDGRDGGRRRIRRTRDDDLIPLSALQHAVYCLRQAALIHLERLWEENRFTAEGRVVHVDRREPGAALVAGRTTCHGLAAGVAAARPCRRRRSRRIPSRGGRRNALSGRIQARQGEAASRRRSTALRARSVPGGDDR